MLREADRRAEALTALERALEISAETESPEIAARVARASRSLDRGFTEAAAWRALSSMDLSYKDRQNLETLLAELHREAPEPPSQDGLRDDAGAAAHPGFSSEHLGSDPRADGRSPRSEGLGLPDAAGSPREGPLTASGVHGEAESAAEPAASVRPAPIDLEITTRELRVVRAQPSELAEDGLVIEIEGGDKRKIGFERVDAVSVVAVEGLGPKFVVVVDLVLNWMSGPSEPLKVIRMRGDQFNPRRFSPDCDSSLDAMRSFTTRLLAQSNATALPDARSVQGTPFASFPNLASYQRTILSVEEENEGGDPTQLMGV
jgi:hypothetical protein